MILLFFSTIIFLPFYLHPPIGFIVKFLSEGKTKTAFILALLAGLFYDGLTNHMAFGVLTLIWMISACIVELFRRLFFLNKFKELFLGTLLFSFTQEIFQGMFFGQVKASLSFHPFYETFVAFSLVWVIPFVQKILRYRRLRSAHN